MSRPHRNTFVFAVCGDTHARRAELALRSFRRFTSCDVVILSARCELPITHDLVVDCPCPREMSNVQCSRYLKTGLHHFLTLDRRYCYVDTDVFAVSERAGEVFDKKSGPIAFAGDPGKTVENFSRYATRGITLPKAIARKFDIDVDPSWPIWNGGVFVFDDESEEFLRTWHQFTCDVFSDRQWSNRDQGTLIAAVWQHGYQHLARLPREYNWLHKLQGGLRIRPPGFHTKSGTEVALLHFPVTYGKTKYESWRAVLRLIDDDTTSSDHIS